MGVTPTDQPAVVQSESVFFAGNNNCVTRRCLQDYIPESLPARIGADAVDKILGHHCLKHARRDHVFV